MLLTSSARPVLAWLVVAMLSGASIASAQDNLQIPGDNPVVDPTATANPGGGSTGAGYAGTGYAETGNTGSAGGPSPFKFNPGHGFVETRLGLYDRPDDGDGNPFLDEELTVIEPILIYSRDSTDTFGYTAQVSYDYVSSASIERLANYEEQSGASGDNYIGADVAFRHLYSPDVLLGWHLGGSSEYDYTSIGVGGSASLYNAEKRRTLTYSLNAFFDSLDIIQFNGVEDGTDSRTSIAATANWYQVITPTVHGELGLTVAQQSGFLSTPYNGVVIEDGTTVPPFPFDNGALGVEVMEELPDSRFRTALFGRARKSLGDGSAIELGGRIYNDDWGITSFSLEPRYYHMLSEDELRMRLRYRYYTQTASDYFDLSIAPGEEDRYNTQDSDLGDFDSHTAGVKFDWMFSESQTLDFGFDFISRSDGLDTMLATFGYILRF